ncbi:MAG TPA: alpha/beta hydrolase [Gammaproteobacteria bacterium]
MLIESFHLGSRGHRRYCSLHRPATRLVHSTGVVLCHPLGHEYFRAHRSYVKLADRIAQLGFPVMRFDYFGAGDSEGDIGHARLDDWLADIADVVDELKRSEPVSGIVLGGMRFGAALALLAAKRINDVRALMLWDPVVDGARYLDEVRVLHGRMLKDLERFARPRRSEECGDGELVGTRYEPRFLHEVAGIRPAALSVEAAGDAILVNTADSATTESRVRKLGGKARWHTTQSPRTYGWTDVHRIGEAIIDPEALRHFTASLQAVAA